MPEIMEMRTLLGVKRKEFTDKTRKAQMIPKCRTRASFHVICTTAVH